MNEEIRGQETVEEKENGNVRMEEGAGMAEMERPAGQKYERQERRGHLKRNIKPFLAGAGMVIAVLAAAWLVKQAVWIPGGTDTPTSFQTDTKIRLIEGLIDDVYVGEKDEEALAEEMYRGLISGLGDPYADYYTAEEYEQLLSSQEGYYEGVGITIGQTESETGAETPDGLEIVEVKEDSPAAQAGIQAGDRLLAVNGTDVTDMSVTEVATLIRTAEDETIVLTLSREGSDEEIVAEVTRERLETDTVAGKMLNETDAYLAISQFTGLTSDQFASVYQDLKNQGMQRLIIDLRGNPGGLLSAVCDTLRQILPEGLIVYTEDKQGDREEYTCDGETPLDIPLVVLVNENSASAAEIFTGAVKDYGIGTIVGQQTFGKGIVQDFYGLPDGSVVKLTVAHYYTPNGNDIHGVGIAPDVTVEQPEDSETDVQLQKALEVLRAM